MNSIMFIKALHKKRFLCEQIMASSLPHFVFVSLLFLIISSFELSFQQTLCCNDERLALLRFKESFVIGRNASGNPFVGPKVDLWKSQGIDCCSWEGVQCDQYTGYVMGLDLSSSCLFGSINSSSSLFRLGHLQYLNLAFNDFNYSEIPAALGNLSRLTYLNLSGSFFYGQIPQEISKLSKLAKLDLSFNLDYSHQGLLKLKRPDFNSLTQNLTRLRWLDLSSVSINSPIPEALANMSSLTYLHLGQCGLLGKFPTSIFHLPKLQILDVDNNWELSGCLSNFHFCSQLRVFDVSNTSFYGELPVSIGMVSSLGYLDVSSCNFSGLVPPSIGNLTKLHVLALQNNSFRGENAPCFSNLTQLTDLNLRLNQFTFREVPSSFASLTHLMKIDLSFNQITGHFPSWITNLTDLRQLSLRSNMLEGSLPGSISRLKNLEVFSLAFNRLSGFVEFDTFLELKSLKFLSLGFNNFSLLIKSTTNRTTQKFEGLGLASCNLREFPGFLRNQSRLNLLNLASNNIHGQIPNWILKISASLWILNLSYNFMTSFEESFFVFPPTSLFYLDLRFNLLRGSLPIPPPSILFYLVSGNEFSGEIPPQFCNMTSLQVLDLSHNDLSGMLPQCFGNLSSILTLNLEDNNFHGPIPETWETGNKIKAIKLGHNYLQGKLPRSLANCKMLEFLDLGNNQIKDTFPSWLGVLPELRILILYSNRFYGAIVIKGPETNLLFPKLCIIDLFDNGFVGALPIDYLARWNAMANLDEEKENATYMHAYDHHVMVNHFVLPHLFPYSMTITNKGEKMEYAKILEVFRVIDLSCNKFEGEIPEAVGNLKGLQLLNLSNNILVGPIPPALGYLKNLEALDLSQNKLTGRIPTQLTQLNFLEVFNVSHNYLTGPIPNGQQFDTFESSSFEGNSGLCGMPLSRKCDYHNSKVLPPPSWTSEGNEDSGLLAISAWKLVLLGYGCGFFVGVIIGGTVFTRRHEWFMKTFRIRQPRRQRKGCGRLNRRMQ